MVSLAENRRLTALDTALYDEVDKTAAAGEEESLFGAAASPARIASGDVRVVFVATVLGVPSNNTRGLSLACLHV